MENGDCHLHDLARSHGPWPSAARVASRAALRPFWPFPYNGKFQPLLGGRSTVGQRTLTPLIGVRIPASQPILQRVPNCACARDLQVRFEFASRVLQFQSADEDTGKSRVFIELLKATAVRIPQTRWRLTARSNWHPKDGQLPRGFLTH